MATTVYHPYTEAPAFTSAQWKELERQAMIYKYMVASVPVPPHLLSSDFTTTTATTTLDHHGYSSIYNLRYGDNKDPEPGRCKRTDGKKWRCSRDVSPQQKYCERHMHRGRPRSRKPVEPLQQENSPKTNKKTRLVSTAPPPPASPRLLGLTSELNNNPSSLLLKNVTKTQDVSLSLFTQHSQNREMEWMMESKMMTMETSEQQWKYQEILLRGKISNTTDWYNLESDHIKAFRCNEFNDFIKEVECLKVARFRELVKYACRTNAILHALELEKKEPGKKRKII